MLADRLEWVIWRSLKPGLASFGLSGVLSTIGQRVFGTRSPWPTRTSAARLLRLLAERYRP